MMESSLRKQLLSCSMSKPRVLIVALIMVLGVSTGSAVGSSDICFLNPIDECSGQRLVELGSSDADTDGKPYTFTTELSDTNSIVNVRLQYKDEFSTSFQNIATSTTNNDWSTPEEFYFSDSNQSVTPDTTTSETMTVGGEAQTFEVYDTNAPSAAGITVNGIDYTKNVGDTLTLNGEIVQLTDIFNKADTNQISDGEWWNYTSSDSTNVKIYLESVIDSNTIFADLNGNEDNFVEGEIVSVGGESLEIREVIYSGGSSGSVIFARLGQGPGAVEFTHYPPITSPEGYNEYRLKIGSNTYTDSVFFSVDKSQNIPFDDSVTVDGQEVKNPFTTNGVTPDSDVTLNVYQEEDDPVNITLFKSDGTKVTTISTGSDWGTFRSIIDSAGDIISTFNGGEATEFVFPTTGSNFLSQQGTQYDFYFEIMDKSTPSNPVRTTKTYSVETSGTATNQQPSINSVEYEVNGTWVNKSQIEFGDNLTRVRANITDPDNIYFNAWLNVENVYDNDERVLGGGPNNGSFYNSSSNNLYTWNLSIYDTVIRDSGTWNVSVAASDGNTVSNYSESFSYPFSEPTVYIDTVDVVFKNKAFYPTVSVGCQQYECINENESVKMYLDPVKSLGVDLEVSP